ncbi:MAG: hypothetical protein RLZZ373_3312 [Pseudomonadota bacterium]|jgi:uncharacterized protein (TIGR00369 family)
MQFPVTIPFVEHLGFELIRFEGGEAEIHVELKPELLNSFLVAHGGLSMTLLDVVMAHAARSVQAESGVVTIEMKTSFFRPGEGRLRAVGKLLHRSATMAFTEGHVYGADGQLCAHATGTFKYVKRLPAAGREIKSLQRREDRPHPPPQTDRSR